MNKAQFMAELRAKLKGIPENEINDRLEYYSEMIDDRLEEGMSEEEATAQIGSPDEIAEQIIAECPVAKIVRERITPKRKLSAFEIILLVLGSPVWLSILIAVIACIISVYAALWSVIIALWSVVLALTVCFIAGIAGLVMFAASGKIPEGLAILGAGLVCGGLSIFMFFGCLEASKGIIKITKKIAIGIRRLIIGRR